MRAWISCGTNTQAILTVINHLHERLGIKDFVLLVTKKSKKNARKAVELSKEFLDASFSDFELGGSEYDLFRNFNKYVNSLRASASEELVLELTGGLKLMPLLLLEASKGKRVLKSYVYSPGTIPSGWWQPQEDLQSGFYPLIPKPLSQFLLLDEDNNLVKQRKKKSLKLPKVIELFPTKPSFASTLIKPITLMTRLMNWVGDHVVELSLEHSLSVKLETEDDYALKRFQAKVNIFNRINKCRCGKTTLDVEQLPGFVGVETFHVKEAFHPVPLVQKHLEEFKGERLLKIFDFVRGQNHFLLLDTGAAYAGIHNDVFEYLVLKRLEGDRNVEDSVKEFLGFHRCSAGELSLWTPSCQHFVKWYSRVLFSIVSYFENKKIRVNGGGPKCDSQFSSAEVIAYPERGRTVIIVTRDKNLFERLKEKGIASVLVTLRPWKPSEDLNSSVRAWAILAQTLFSALLLNSDHLCSPLKYELRGVTYLPVFGRGGPTQGTSELLLKGDWGEVTFSFIQ